MAIYKRWHTLFGCASVLWSLTFLHVFIIVETWESSRFQACYGCYFSCCYSWLLVSFVSKYHLKNKEVSQCIIYTFASHMWNSYSMPHILSNILREHYRICFFHSPYCVLCFVGSGAKTCKELSKTYTTGNCHGDPCVEACHKDGFIDGTCLLVWGAPAILKCFCMKQCWLKICWNYLMMVIIKLIRFV